MGNRCVISTKNKDLEIYLHWNGGYGSVEAFLKYCEEQGFRCPSYDSYGWARLCQVISNYFGPNGLSIGIGPYGSTDASTCDNGRYIIENWKIVGREDYEGEEQENEYTLAERLESIEAAQPKEDDGTRYSYMVVAKYVEDTERNNLEIVDYDLDKKAADEMAKELDNNPDVELVSVWRRDNKGEIK